MTISIRLLGPLEKRRSPVAVGDRQLDRGAVSDVGRAKDVYTALLGIEPQADAPYYVGYDVGGHHVGLVLATVTSAGGTVNEAPRDVGNGRLVATFTDPDGNVLGLFQEG